MFVLRGFHIGAVMLAYGTFVFALLLGWRRDDSGTPFEGRQELGRRLRRLAFAGAVLCLLSWLVWLGFVAAEMSGLPLEQALAPSVLATVVERTLFGHVWLLRLVLMLLLLAGVALCGRAWSRSARGMSVAGVLVSGLLLATLAGAGHAVDSAVSGRWLHPAVDAVHLLAAGAWLGALVPLVWLVSRARAASAWHGLAALATERFSTLGVIAVAAIVASGAVNAWYLVGDWSALVTTDYGRLLCLKLLLFAAVLGLAAHNRNVLRPRIAAGPAGPEAAVALRRLWRNAVIELCLGAAILVVVGALGMTPPAIHAQAGMHQGMDHAMPMD